MVITFTYVTFCHQQQFPERTYLFFHQPQYSERKSPHHSREEIKANNSPDHSPRSETIEVGTQTKFLFIECHKLDTGHRPRRI